MTTRRAESRRPLPRRRCPPTPRRGMVLFVVVIFVAMVSLAGLSYVAVMSMEHKAARLRGDELQVEMAVGSGIEAIRAYLARPPGDARAAADRGDPQRRFRGVVVADDAAGGRRTRFSVVSPRVEAERTGGLRFGLSNESARLNLGTLIEWDRLHPGSARDALMKLPEMSQSIADAILDWIDPDSDPRGSGAEASYYSGLGLPYGPRNAEPTSLEELLLVRDVTRRQLFGADENFNYRIDAGEQAAAGTRSLSPAGAMSSPWAMLLTVFSAEKNARPDGKPKIDLNERDLRSLQGKLVEVIDSDLATFLILCRQYRQVRIDGTAGGGVPIRTIQLDLAAPARYQFTSPLDLLGIAGEVPANGEQAAPRMVHSPLAASG
ncbi:MAG: type II secretion system protein GspK, partial [Pirellulales bacterium]|nr:type II secretion system protein GspK [Pirellulales bacterium]